MIPLYIFEIFFFKTRLFIFRSPSHTLCHSNPSLNDRLPQAMWLGFPQAKKLVNFLVITHDCMGLITCPSDMLLRGAF